MCLLHGWFLSYPRYNIVSTHRRGPKNANSRRWWKSPWAKIKSEAKTQQVVPQHSCNTCLGSFSTGIISFTKNDLAPYSNIGCSTNLVLQGHWPGDQLSVWSSSETGLWHPETVFWALSCSCCLIGRPSCDWIKQPARVGWYPFLSPPWTHQQVTGGETQCQPTIFNAFLLRIRNRRQTRKTKGKNPKGPGPCMLFFPIHEQYLNSLTNSISYPFKSPKMIYGLKSKWLVIMTYKAINTWKGFGWWYHNKPWEKLSGF